MGFNFILRCDLHLFEQVFFNLHPPCPRDWLCRPQCFHPWLPLLLEDSSESDVWSSKSVDKSVDSELSLEELLEGSLEELHLLFLLLHCLHSGDLGVLLDELLYKLSLDEW